jgi:hypothetical protein
MSEEREQDDAEWAAQEFGAAELGDARRTARLVELATRFGQNPGASLPEAMGDRAALKAAYRFFDNEAVEHADVVASHVQATYARLAQVPLVLAAQDTTYVDWTHHPATTGLGRLAHEYSQGLVVHSTLAMTPERVPLGLLAQKVWVRPDLPPVPLPADGDARVPAAGPADESVPALTAGDLKAAARRARRAQQLHKERPLAEKESYCWVESIQSTLAAHDQCPDTHFVNISDREGDIYDVLCAPRPGHVDVLVRAVRDRRVEQYERYLWAAVAAQPIARVLTVTVPRQAHQPAREATLFVRWRRVIVKPPKHRAVEKLPRVVVWVVWAVEPRPPEGVEPLDWLLLTSVSLADTDAAVQVLDWYACRWGIEVWHKVLKSGCRIEASQLGTGARLQRLLAVYSVVAWRLLYATLLARAVPDGPCTLLLDDDEWQALYCTIHQTPTPPAEPPPLRIAVHWIARLGGFLDRALDGEPGVTVLWKGFQHLADLATMYRIMRPTTRPPRRITPPRRNVGKD